MKHTPSESIPVGVDEAPEFVDAALAWVSRGFSRTYPNRLTRTGGTAVVPEGVIGFPLTVAFIPVSDDETRVEADTTGFIGWQLRRGVIDRFFVALREEGERRADSGR